MLFSLHMHLVNRIENKVDYYRLLSTAALVKFVTKVFINLHRSSYKVLDIFQILKVVEISRQILIKGPK
jgi:hypothetical protein